MTSTPVKQKLTEQYQVESTVNSSFTTPVKEKPAEQARTQNAVERALFADVDEPMAATPPYANLAKRTAPLTSGKGERNFFATFAGSPPGSPPRGVHKKEKENTPPAAGAAAAGCSALSLKSRAVKKLDVGSTTCAGAGAPGRAPPAKSLAARGVVKLDLPKTPSKSKSADATGPAARSPLAPLDMNRKAAHPPGSPPGKVTPKKGTAPAASGMPGHATPPPGSPPGQVTPKKGAAPAASGAPSHATPPTPIKPRSGDRKAGAATPKYVTPPTPSRPRSMGRAGGAAGAAAPARPVSPLMRVNKALLACSIEIGSKTYALDILAAGTHFQTYVFRSEQPLVNVICVVKGFLESHLVSKGEKSILIKWLQNSFIQYLIAHILVKEYVAEIFNSPLTDHCVLMRFVEHGFEGDCASWAYDKTKAPKKVEELDAPAQSRLAQVGKLYAQALVVYDTSLKLEGEIRTALGLPLKENEQLVGWQPDLIPGNLRFDAQNRILVTDHREEPSELGLLGDLQEGYLSCAKGNPYIYLSLIAPVEQVSPEFYALLISKTPKI
jgi:hypothetical protein